MPDAVIEKQTCAKCDVEIRENTSFCYNCGSPIVAEIVGSISIPTEPTGNGVSPAVEVETKAALNDLAERFRVDEEDDDKLATAAAERRKARIRSRKSIQYVWEPIDEDSGRFFLHLAIAVAAIVAGITYFTVFWR